jgi:hypothetical protein
MGLNDRKRPLDPDVPSEPILPGPDHPDVEPDREAWEPESWRPGDARKAPGRNAHSTGSTRESERSGQEETPGRS